MVDIGSNGKCSCKEGHEKRYSQMEKPSQHVWEQAAPLVQCLHCNLVKTGYRRRRQRVTSLFVAAVGYSPGSAPLPVRGKSPNLVAQRPYASKGPMNSSARQFSGAGSEAPPSEAPFKGA